MTAPLSSVTPAERIAAQDIVYQLALKRDKWKPGDHSLFLMSPTAMAQLFSELEELRAFKAKHETK